MKSGGLRFFTFFVSWVGVRRLSSVPLSPFGGASLCLALHPASLRPSPSPAPRGVLRFLGWRSSRLSFCSVHTLFFHCDFHKKSHLLFRWRTVVFSTYGGYLLQRYIFLEKQQIKITYDTIIYKKHTEKWNPSLIFQFKKAWLPRCGLLLAGFF